MTLDMCLYDKFGTQFEQSRDFEPVLDIAVIAYVRYFYPKYYEITKPVVVSITEDYYGNGYYMCISAETKSDFWERSVTIHQDPKTVFQAHIAAKTLISEIVDNACEDDTIAKDKLMKAYDMWLKVFDSPPNPDVYEEVY